MPKKNATPSKPAPKTRHAPPVRRKNADSRERGEYLTPGELAQLRAAAASVGRHRDRDSTMIFIAYRHALRVSELTELEWNAIEFKVPRVWVSRKKGSNSGHHPLAKDELKALKALAPKEEYRVGYVFKNERGGKLTESCVRKLVARAGKLAGFPFHVHPHQLRHACGHTMANKKIPTGIIQHWLGHVNAQHTGRYAVIDDETLRGIWE
jgi:type 1 fimbriae regulatory protein FimB/type 1 fimbriae regulatory protein FimE